MLHWKNYFLLFLEWFQKSMALILSTVFVQHFPMYRPSDSNCTTPDRAPDDEIDVPFREKWDCLSKESTKEVCLLLTLCLLVSSPLQTVWIQICAHKCRLLITFANSLDPDFCLLVSSADKLCKQFGPRSGPKKCRAWSGSKLFDTLKVFQKEFFKKFTFRKTSRWQKSMRNYPVGKELNPYNFKSFILKIFEGQILSQNNSNSWSTHTTYCKTNNVAVHLEKTQISLGTTSQISLGTACSIRLFNLHLKKVWILSCPVNTSEGSDQTWQMLRLSWVFAQHTLNLLVLSCHGSFGEALIKC